MTFHLNVHNIHELTIVAKKILNSCPGKKIFAFLGEMGSGKTTLISAMCEELGINGQASSPTFAIINEYNGDEKIFHIDLYRLRSLPEAIDIGIEEYLESGNYCFIEWAELIEKLLPPETVIVRLSEGENKERFIQLNC